MSDAGDVFRVAITGASPQAGVWQSVFHYVQNTGAGVSTDAIGAAIGVQYGLAYTNMEGKIASDYSADLLEMWIRDTVNERWDGIYSAILGGLVGTSGSDASAHGVAIVGLVLTQLLRRQGRTFLPGVVEGNSTDGLWQAATLASMLLFLDDFDDDISVAGETLSWCTYNTDPLSPVFQTPSKAIQSASANSIIGYQRRRKPGVGI